MHWLDYVPFADYFVEEEKMIEESESSWLAGDVARTSKLDKLHQQNNQSTFMQNIKWNEDLKLFLAISCLFLICKMIPIVYR